MKSKPCACNHVSHSLIGSGEHSLYALFHNLKPINTASGIKRVCNHCKLNHRDHKLEGINHAVRESK